MVLRRQEGRGMSVVAGGCEDVAEVLAQGVRTPAVP